MDLDEYVKVIEDDKSLTVRMNSVILFDLGKADIKEPGKETLRKIGTLIKQLNKNAVIQGHTDNLPINTMLFLQLGAVNKEGNQRCIVSCRRMRCGSGETNCYSNGEFRP